MKKENTSQLVFLIASAAVLQIMESFIPHPIPGVRLGLANLMTLVALYQLGFRAALKIAVLRSVIGSLIMGTFLSPAFFLSVSGGVLSTVIMGIVFLSNSKTNPKVSIIGISLLGAMAHNITQITLVYFFFIQHQSVFMLLPLLGISGVVTGWITGMIAGRVCIKIESNVETSKDELNLFQESGSEFKVMHYVDTQSRIHRIPALIKIVTILCVGVVSILFPQYEWFLALLGLFLFLIISSNIPVLDFIKAPLKIWPILLFSFLAPLFFTQEGTYILSLGQIHLTQQGLEMGIRFSARLILLLLYTALLIKTTHPIQLSRGLSCLLYPLKWIGMNPEKLSKLMIDSWNLLPLVWQQITGLLKIKNFQGKTFSENLSMLSYVISNLYLQTEQENTKS